MFEVTLQTNVPENFCHVDGGPSGGSSVRRPGSEDIRRVERKLILLTLLSASLLKTTNLPV